MAGTETEKARATLSLAAVDSGKLGAGALLAGRFVIDRMLGEGGMGRVFAAFDKSRNDTVALKMLGSPTAAAIPLIKREFRAASEIVHPNLVRLHELFSDEDDWFFTMDLVEGAPLSNVLTRHRGSREELVRHVFRQLALALFELHRHGTLHGDIKPSNFLIGEPSGHVTLLDFGLSGPALPTPATTIDGTPAYMAPELLMGGPRTQAADWCSFGLVLSEALTGALPSRISPQPLPDDIPVDLRNLCERLTDLDPSKRPGGEEVVASLGAAPAPPISRPVPRATQFVGREKELSILEHALCRIRRCEEPELFLVTGPSGIGKTSLIEHFIAGAERQGSMVLRSRCRERESLRYKAVDGLVDSLVRELAEGVEPSLARPLADLAILFPIVGTLPGVVPQVATPPAPVEPREVRRRAIAAFQLVLASLNQPLVLWIDDLQWSDSESAALLSPVVAGSLPLLFVGSWRETSSGGCPLLDALCSDERFSPAVQRIEVPPLSEKQAFELVRSRIAKSQPNRETLVKNAVQEGGGHPLFTTELALAAVQQPDVTIQAESTLSALLSRRIETLPSSARELLIASALAGAPLPRHVLRRAIGIDEHEGESAADVLRASRLLRSQGLSDADLVEVHHDRIAEAVLTRISETDRRSRHRSIAAALRNANAGTPEILATQYEGAGDPERAGRQWLAGARAAMASLAFDHASQLFERGARLADLSTTERRSVKIETAEALALAGKGPRAAQLYLEAAAQSDAEAARDLRRKAGEQYLVSGHLDRGLEVLSEVLGATGIERAPTGWRWLPTVLLRRARLVSRGLGYDIRSESELPAEALAQVDALYTIASSLGAMDPAFGFEFQTAHLHRALDAGEPLRLLRAISLEASFMAAPGWQRGKRAARLQTTARELAERTGSRAAEGFLDLFDGIGSYLRGELQAAQARFERAVLVFSEQPRGYLWELATAQRFLVATLFFRGELGRLYALVPRLVQDAEGNGDTYATMFLRASYASTTWLVKDEVNECRRHLDRARSEWANSNYPIPTFNIVLGESYYHLYQLEPERILDMTARIWRSMAQAGLLRIGITRLQLWQIRAAAALSSATNLAARGQRTRARDLRAEGRSAIRQLASTQVPRASPMAAVLAASADRAEGNVVAACKGLQSAIVEFDRLGMRLFSATAKMRLSGMTRGSEAQRLCDDAEKEFAREGIARPDRIVDMLAPGAW